MHRERAARVSFSRKIRDNESTVAGFYGDAPYFEEDEPKPEPKAKPGFWESLIGK
jgi:hypothetical protein